MRTRGVRKLGSFQRSYEWGYTGVSSAGVFLVKKLELLFKAVLSLGFSRFGFCPSFCPPVRGPSGSRFSWYLDSSQCLDLLHPSVLPLLSSPLVLGAVSDWSLITDLPPGPDFAPGFLFVASLPFSDCLSGSNAWPFSLSGWSLPQDSVALFAFHVLPLFTKFLSD